MLSVLFLILLRMYMPLLTIPKTLIKEGDLIIIPRKEYESLLELKKIKEFMPTPAQKRALARAEKNLKRGKTLSYNEFTKKLGFTN